MGSEDAYRSFENETNSSTARHRSAARMDAEEALSRIGPHLPEALNDRERDLFRGIWQGQSYQEIYNASFRNRCQLNHLRSNIAGGLWKKLRPTLGAKVNKGTLKGAVEVAVQRWQAESARPGPNHSSATITQPLQSAQPGPSLPDPARPNPAQSPTRTPPASSNQEQTPLLADSPPCAVRSWRDSPDVTSFCGRTAQLEESEQQILMERCRLLTICGEAGVGKTWFAKQLALQLLEQYERIAWVTFPKTGPAPTLEALLTDLMKTLGGDRPGIPAPDMPTPDISTPDIPAFVDFLMDHPSLIVLDQFETLLQAGVDNGAYQSGYATYGDLLTQLGQRPHLGCIIITSRERPNEPLAAPDSLMLLQLPGFAQLEAEEFLASRGYGNASPSVWRRLSQQCNGNPKALQAVASWIREAHLGDVEDFLATPSSFPLEIMAEQAAQLERLSLLEQEIVVQLCQQEPPLLTAQVLREMTISSPGSRPNALQSLLRRSLLSSVPERQYTYRVSPLMQQYLRHCRSSPI